MCFIIYQSFGPSNKSPGHKLPILDEHSSTPQLGPLANVYITMRTSQFSITPCSIVDLNY